MRCKINTDKAAIWAAIWEKYEPADLAALPTRYTLQGGELLFAKDYNGRRWRFDWALPSAMVAVEIDGGAYAQGRHTRGAGFESDCEKGNMALLLGWRVFHFTPGMLRRDPLACVQIVAEVARRELGKFSG